MFQETNRANFSKWIGGVVQGSLQNENLHQDFQWKSKIDASPFDLLQRLQHCLELNEQLIVSGLCLVKKTANSNCKLTLNSIYKLSVVCVYIAQKFFSDFRISVEDFSLASGVRMQDILELEWITLQYLNYNVMLTERDYYNMLLFGKV